MTHEMQRELERLASLFDADGWSLVRSGRHLVVDFAFADGTIRQIFSSTPSDHRTRLNQRSTMRRILRVVS